MVKVARFSCAVRIQLMQIAWLYQLDSHMVGSDQRNLIVSHACKARIHDD